jgi:hypothetical protein
MMGQPGSGEADTRTEAEEVPTADNSLKDVQNILGFLVAGFAGVLSFLGIRSGEVSAVLRNASTEGSASFIMLILFLAAFAAVSGVALSRARKMSPWWIEPIVLALIGIGLILIWITPVNEANKGLRSSGMHVGVGLIVLAGAVAIDRAIFLLRGSKNKNFSARFKGGGIPSEGLCILVGLALLGFGIYGAIRLEAYSQRLASVQLSASIAKEASDADLADLNADLVDLSVHVTGSKLTNRRYVGVSIRGAPREADFATMCENSYPNSYENCLGYPCQYLPSACHFIYGAAVPANANGELNYTLNDGIVSGDYLEISVQAFLCKQGAGCTVGTKPISQLDINVAKPSTRVPSPSPSPKVR